MKRVLMASLVAAEFRGYVFKTEDGKMLIPKKTFGQGVPTLLKVTIEDEALEDQPQAAAKSTSEGVKV